MANRPQHPASLTAAPDDPVYARRADTNERFVAFTFAGADLVVEADSSGIVTYAAGAFRTRFGRSPESLVGQHIRQIIAPADTDVLDTALSLLVERGRLRPLLIRVADAARTPLALAGIVLPTPGRPPRLCLTLALAPTPLSEVRKASTPHALARATEARLRTGAPVGLSLVEFVGSGSVVMQAGEAIGQALGTMAPDSVAREVAPGRYGLLGPPTTQTDLLAITNLLEAALRKQGVAVSVAARQLPMPDEELSPTQTARALRQALNVFAREGAEAVGKAGFDGGLAGYMRRASTQAASLRQAIREGQFSLAFQPIVSLADRSLHHVEALLRPKPVEGCTFAGPQEFVMLVEALGLADELDLAVAKLACAAAAESGVSIAFNLSGQSVQSSGFRARLGALLASSEACHRGLVLVEMTETAEIEALEEAGRTAEALRSLGVPFCLDDFGAGATDIRLLRGLNPNIVKLDGSYIPGITQGGRERAFVAGIVEIVRAAGAEIVAERVETAAEAEALRALGVQYGQGWLFGRPTPHPGGKPLAPARAG